MKRIISLVLVIVMAFGFGMPNVKAVTPVDDSGRDHHRAEHYTYDGAQVEEAFQRNQVKDLYNAQKILVPSNMSKVKITETEDGIKFSGKRANLQAGRIDINKQFRFSDNYVGRFSIEATRAVAKPITIKFYIDADINPFCSIAIGREGRIDPVREIEKQEQSRVVMEEVITGHHSLSFSFETDCEEAEVTFKTFEFVQSALPVVSFDIDENEGTVDEMNTSKNHSAECHGNMNINVPAGYTNEYSNNLVSASYPMEYIRGRGNSTWSCDKKPYKIKLKNKNGLLGMPANKHWVLIANVYDNSKMRNKMTYELGNRLNMPYTPRSVPVDVVMNGEYYGSYYLSEQIRLGENRVDLPDLTDTKTELTDDEITGGYLLSLDYADDSEDCFQTERGNEYTLESPKKEDWQNADTSFDEVKDYIQGYLNNCEEAMFSEDYKTKEGVPFSNLIDVDRMVSYYLFQEISQNGDAYGGGSNYLYKDRNGKICWGPLWDFDYVAWAGNEYYEGEDQYRFQSSTMMWNARMLLNDDCWDRLQEIYAQMKAELLDMISQDGYIDQLYNSLRASMYYDIERNGFYEHNSDEEPYTYSFVKERDRLKRWIKGKLDYVDAHIQDWQPKQITITFKADDQVISEQHITQGESAVLPEAPAKEEYVFVGWFYTDDEGQESQVDESTGFEEDTTVYAKYTAEKDIVAVKDIVMRTDDVYVKLSNSAYNVSYVVNPANATFTDCELISSNPDVVKADSEFSTNVLQLLQVGDSTITVKAHNGIAKDFVIHVVPDDYEVELDGISFEDGAIELEKNESKLVNFNLNPANAPWTSEIDFIVGDNSVVEMDQFGILTAISPGKTFVLARYKETNKLIEVIVKDDTPVETTTEETTTEEPTTVEPTTLEPTTQPVETTKKQEETTAKKDTVSKDVLTMYGEFLKANNYKYYSIMMQSNAKPLLIVTNSVKKGKYSKNVTVYTVYNNKVVKVGNLKAKKGYIKHKSNTFVTKFSKKSIGYYKVKAACFTGNKYVKKKKKYYRYKLNCTKFVKKKKISKKKGKKYLKAKGSKSIVFTAK